MPQNDLVTQRRDLMDMVAETRSRAVRIALFGTQLHRRDPDDVETASQRTAYKNVLRSTLDWLTRTHHIMKNGRGPSERVPAELCEWLTGFIEQSPEVIPHMDTMLEASQKVVDAAWEDNDDLGKALSDHYEAHRAGFMEAITALCEKIWAQIDLEYETEINRARDASEAIRTALEDLEAIGKHVQLVSLNATVEAARVGDQGRGLGIIAVEFKRLAEEIQDISRTAREDIAKMTGT